MVLPIIIGVGVTAIALGAQSGLKAWQIYRTLSPLAIAKLNNIRVPPPSYMSNDFRFKSSLIHSSLRARLNQYPGGFQHHLTESEALLILNITPAEISNLNGVLLKQKHRKAVLQNHPDKGGSPYLTAKINEARDVISNSILLRGK